MTTAVSSRARARGDAVFVLAFATLPMTLLTAPGLSLPLSELVVGFAVLVALLRRPGRATRPPAWLSIGLWSVFALLGLSTILNGLETFEAAKRMAHVLLYVLLALTLARGSIPRRAAASGLGLGLVLSAGVGMMAALTDLVPIHYAGHLTGLSWRLTGLFGDPNVAGYLLVALGSIAVAGRRPGWPRTTLALFLAGAVVLTLSRTSLLALGFGAIWILIGRRLRPALGLGLIAVLGVAVAFLPTAIQSVGPFQNRVGSDELRARIVASELQAISDERLLGHGAGTATVVIDNGLVFFFHDSYLALVAEGGFATLLVLSIVLLSVFWRLVSLPPRWRDPWLEVSLIAVAVCAINLGEVLLELTAAVAIGLAVGHVLEVSEASGAVDQKASAHR